MTADPEMAAAERAVIEAVIAERIAGREWMATWNEFGPDAEETEVASSALNELRRKRLWAADDLLDLRIKRGQP